MDVSGPGQSPMDMGGTRQPHWQPNAGQTALMQGRAQQVPTAAGAAMGHLGAPPPGVVPHAPMSAPTAGGFVLFLRLS